MNAAEAEIVRWRGSTGCRHGGDVDRFVPHVAIIRDWLARGVLGDVVYVTADYGQW